jgi:hypothetical protein
MQIHKQYDPSNMHIHRYTNSITCYKICLSSTLNHLNAHILHHEPSDKHINQYNNIIFSCNVIFIFRKNLCVIVNHLNSCLPKLNTLIQLVLSIYKNIIYTCIPAHYPSLLCSAVVFQLQRGPSV